MTDLLIQPDKVLSEGSDIVQQCKADPSLCDLALEMLSYGIRILEPYSQTNQAVYGDLLQQWRWYRDSVVHEWNYTCDKSKLDDGWHRMFSFCFDQCHHYAGNNGDVKLFRRALQRCYMYLIFRRDSAGLTPKESLQLKWAESMLREFQISGSLHCTSFEEWEHSQEPIQVHDVNTDRLSANDLNTNRLPVGNVLPTSDLNLDRLPVDNLPANDLNLDRLPANDLTLDRLPANDINLDRLPANDLNLDRLPANDLNLDRLPANDLNLDRLPADDINLDRLPTDDLNLDRLPTDSSSPANDINLNRLPANDIDFDPLPVNDTLPSNSRVDIPRMETPTVPDLAAIHVSTEQPSSARSSTSLSSPNAFRKSIPKCPTMQDVEKLIPVVPCITGLDSYSPSSTLTPQAAVPPSVPGVPMNLYQLPVPPQSYIGCPTNINNRPSIDLMDPYIQPGTAPLGVIPTLPSPVLPQISGACMVNHGVSYRGEDIQFCCSTISRVANRLTYYIHCSSEFQSLISELNQVYNVLRNRLN